MERDMDLLRKILLDVEKQPNPVVETISPDLSSSIDETKLAYHVHLLGEAGLLTVWRIGSKGPAWAMPRTLTWQGHEFIDAMRDDTIWNKAKSGALKAGGWTLHTLLSFGVAELRVKLGLPPM
jgi:hypothetical protein